MTDDQQRDLDRLYRDLTDALDLLRERTEALTEARATITGLERTLAAREDHLEDVRALMAPRTFHLGNPGIPEPGTTHKPTGIIH